MNAELLERGRVVVYVPHQAHGDKMHPDCERGIVTSWTADKELVFVRFGSQQHSKATPLRSLVLA